MAFISNSQKMIGKRVILNRDVEVLSGTFQKGTEMTITGDGERGLDLVDDEGNILIETGRMGHTFFDLYNPTSDDLRLKNG